MTRATTVATVVALSVLLAGCVGRNPVGESADLSMQTLPLSDIVPDDIPDAVADVEEITPWVPDADVPFVPDVPPLECQTDADCPPTGAEPCYVSVCSPDETTGMSVCRSTQGLECSNDDPCLDAVCAVGEGCVDVAGPDGVPCDDGNACTHQDTCTSGFCHGQEPDCSDSNPCTADLCDAATGECYYLSIPTACDDGDLCTQGDQCVDGACAPGAPVSCDDFEPCTEDSCIPDVGCLHKPVPGCCTADFQCTDGNECTKDSCIQLECLHSPVSCNDNNPCTVDACAPQSGCLFEKVPGCCLTVADCTDADQCTIPSCVNGACQYAPAPPCKDGNPCTQDTCDPQIGCVFLPIAGCCLVDGDCQDDNACTVEGCVNGQCAYKPVACADANPCTKDGCEPAAGCLFTPIPDCCLSGADCNDQNVCTQDWCSGNACQHEAVGCADDDPCTADSCHPVSGCQHKPVPGCCHSDPDCQTGNPCEESWCDGHECVSAPVPCDDGNVCTADTCKPETGCVFVPLAGCCHVGAECNDGDVCTTDQCVNHKCVHEPVVSPACCAPDCAGKECGLDGCGGLCGQCPGAEFCNEDNQCAIVCTPDCKGKECGPDGCGTFCGICEEGLSCSADGQCTTCVPSCAGKTCGPDGCGGSCGFCPVGKTCDSQTGQCGAACECLGASCYQDGFEAGELAGWSFEGDAEVIHNMGAAEAPQGWYMAFVGTGLSELKLGKLQKTFCPTSDKNFFGFKWKLYSAEFQEWCGSIYQDRFIVSASNGTSTITLLDLAIDELCPAEACAGCGDKYIGLQEADVIFDYEDVWMTPWSTAFLELPPDFTDKPVTITFEVSDVGDMVYVTAILIDSIQFL